LFHTSKEPPKDAKSSLQEWLQKQGKSTPIYNAIGVTGPDHNPIFECEVTANGLPTSFKGKGRNRRSAEQDAAKAAMAWVGGSRNSSTT
jgi:ribonuclease-3